MSNVKDYCKMLAARKVIETYEKMFDEEYKDFDKRDLYNSEKFAWANGYTEGRYMMLMEIITEYHNILHDFMEDV